MDKKKYKIIDIKDIPIESSLGLLAAGDVVFTEWKKKIRKERKKNEKK
ncbi:hypothetical protein [Mesonia sp. K7]|nr:hypothetical protein [Mesonia sp. K7]